ncbi:hypothetical protein Hokovirus_3_146 [Hokovirus HKV1]|uniref:Uncharacterized protein n=1 Tax=Hokovirus HKV1 TaxID=1977638 RepID=A0A1V0SGN8_9VIRU|nr:hypothetical protein Hokovirus_3_146 [Hokovirus HKV1]
MLEVEDWINCIEQVFNITDKIYLKGGSVLGFYLLKIFIEQNKINSENFDIIKKFIKDYDFMIIIKDHQEKNKIKNIFLNNNFIDEGKSFVVLRHKNKLLINNEALFELSMKYKETKTDFEMPLTRFKIKLTRNNINNIFTIADNFYNNNDNNIHLTKLLEETIIIPKSNNGLFDVKNIDMKNVNKLIIQCLDNIDHNMKQFIISHFVQPDRLFFRLDKNLCKTRLIYDIIKKYEIKQDTNWLITDENYLNSNILLFLQNINNLFKNIAIKNNVTRNNFKNYDLLIILKTYYDNINQINILEKIKDKNIGIQKKYDKLKEEIYNQEQLLEILKNQLSELRLLTNQDSGNDIGIIRLNIKNILDNLINSINNMFSDINNLFMDGTKYAINIERLNKMIISDNNSYIFNNPMILKWLHLLVNILDDDVNDIILKLIKDKKIINNPYINMFYYIHNFKINV